VLIFNVYECFFLKDRLYFPQLLIVSGLFSVPAVLLFMGACGVLPLIIAAGVVGLGLCLFALFSSGTEKTLFSEKDTALRTTHRIMLTVGMLLSVGVILTLLLSAFCNVSTALPMLLSAVSVASMALSLVLPLVFGVVATLGGYVMGCCKGKTGAEEELSYRV
jgi:hypothetical protein